MPGAPGPLTQISYGEFSHPRFCGSDLEGKPRADTHTHLHTIMNKDSDTPPPGTARSPAPAGRTPSPARTVAYANPLSAASSKAFHGSEDMVHASPPRSVETEVVHMGGDSAYSQNSQYEHAYPPHCSRVLPPPSTDEFQTAASTPASPGITVLGNTLLSDRRPRPVDPDLIW